MTADSGEWPGTRLGRVALLGLPLLLVAIVGWPSVSGGLIRDDVLYITSNPHVIEPVPVSLILGTPFQPDLELGLYRPLTTLSFRLDYLVSQLTQTQVSPESARVFHLTSLALAGVSALLLGSLARALGCSTLISLAVAALFAVHPARSDAAFWISGRAESLMTLFSLAALCVASRGSRGWRAPVTALAAAAAFLSKEQGAVLILLIPLLPSLEARDRWRHLLWSGAVITGLFLWRWQVLGGLGPQGDDQVLIGTGWLERLEFSVAALADYIGLMFWPHPLLNEYDVPIGGLSAWQGLSVCGFLAVAAWGALRRDMKVLFALGLFLLPLAPVLNLFYRTGETFAVRFMTLPTAGFVLFLAFSFSRMPRVATAVLLGATVAGGVSSWERSLDFRNELALSDAQLRDGPDHASSFLFRAALLRSGRLLDGPKDPTELQLAEERLLREALERAPQLTEARLELALQLTNAATRSGNPDGALARERLQEAERHARRVTEQHPEVARGALILGMNLGHQGRLRESAAALQRGLELEPRFLPGTRDLASILRKQGEPEAAREALENAYAAAQEARTRRFWDPAIPAQQARIARLLDRPVEALRHFQEALALSYTTERKVRFTLELMALLREQGEADRAGAQLAAVIDELERRTNTLRPQYPLLMDLAKLERLRDNDARAAEWAARARQRDR